MKLPSIILIALFVSTAITAQNSQVTIINEVVTALKGEQNKSEVPVFHNMKEVCRSKYFSCNKKGQLIGFDFQFANLNGYIPESISQLQDLEYINLEYNYLAGLIPSGLTKLKKLEELTINGNFLTGPLPADLVDLDKQAQIDLSQNTIKTDNQKFIKKFKITNQINLEGCRSPDSIFLDMPEGFLQPPSEFLSAVKPKKEKKDKKTKRVVEQMPRFPGCEEKNLSNKEKEKCAKEKMLQYIYRNLRYPAEARLNDVEGMAVVQFVILEDGNMGYAKIVRDLEARCGNASLWIVNRMNFICDRWVPGEQAGEKVKVLYTLPIKFKLQ